MIHSDTDEEHLLDEGTAVEEECESSSIELAREIMGQ